MKKILSLVLSVILVVSLFPSRNAFAVGEFTIRGIDASAFPGEQVSVDIMLENNPGISAINLYYIFDADYLTLTKVENKVSSFAMTHVTTTVWDSVSNFADDGVLGTLHFDIAENTPAGEYEVEIMFLSASNDEFEEVVAQTVSATVVVQETGCSHAAKREVPAKSATCEKGGNRRYYVCDSCGLVFKADGVTETTVAAEQIPALGHSFTGWTVIQEPTTSEEGLEIRTCTRCDYEEQRTIPKLDAPAVIASGTCGDNLTWTLTDDGCLTISGSGAMYDYGNRSAPWYGHRANITSVVIGNSVSTIGDEAFSYCAKLSSVEIGNGVITIGDLAFFSCQSLRSVVIPDNVLVIGDWAFCDCGSLSSVEISDSVISIGKIAFGSCDNLSGIFVDRNNPYYCNDDRGVLFDKQKSTLIQAPGAISDSYTIPDSVTTIGYEAFSYCANLSSVKIGNSVTTIGDIAFSDCGSLSSVKIGNSVTTIGDRAFSDCDSLSRVVIPDSVTTIGDSAFAWCDSLSSVKFRGNAPTFGKKVFENVTATAFYTANNSTWTADVMQDYSGTITWVAEPELEPGLVYEVYEDHVEITGYTGEATELVIPTQIEGLPVTVIGEQAFRGDNLISVEIPDSVIIIGQGAFVWCDSLSRVAIPDSVTTISDFAFFLCNSLSSVEIPDSVTSIGIQAFAGCKSMSSVKFRGNAPTVGDKAFGGVTTTAYYPAYNSTWTDDVMQDYGGTITWVADASGHVHEYTTVVTAPTCTKQGYTTHTCRCGASYVDSYTAALGHSFTNYVSNGDATCTEDGTKTAVCDRCDAENTVRDTGSATGHHYEGSVTAPTCTERGYTTYTCECGDSYIADYVDALGHNMGKWTTQKAATCTQNGREIRECSRCDHSETRTVAALGHSFTGWTVVQEPTTSKEGLEIRTCTRCDYEEQRTVPKLETPDLIASGVCGDDLVWELAVDGCLTISGTGAMYDVGSFDSPWYDYNEQIMSIVIEDGAASIGDYAFYYCEEATSIQIPGSVTEIGENAFQSCERISELILPDDLVSIGSRAFFNCTSLTGIVIPASVTTIGDNAFWDCESLEEIVVESANREYSSCDGVLYNKQQTSLVVYPAGKAGTFNVPASVTRIEDWAFYGAAKLSGVTIPDRVKYIGDSAFRECRNLAAVQIPTGIYTISRDTFSFCDSLTQITIPSNIRWIDQDAFAYCDNLERITFEGDAPEFEEDVFLGVTAEAYYPADNATWTVDVRKSYGGRIVWLPYEEKTLPFTDVPDGSFFYEPVAWAVERGITTGATATTFNPNGTCLRAHVVTFLYRAAGNPEPFSSNNPFSDVKTSDFFYKPVLWAVDKGITNGTTATTFGSFANCNRAAVVTFLWRAAGSPEPQSNSHPFVDVKTTDFFYKPVLWAVENGITNGVDATHFGPTTDCNRAQVVTFLYRVYT